jgi:hypothetical protein
VNLPVPLQNPQEWLLPDYGRYGLAQIPATIRALFGSGPATELRKLCPPETPRVVVLLLIDGLGYDQWQEFSTRFEFFKTVQQSGRVIPITSVFPSSTAPNLTTLHTGKTPAEHGLVEWWVYFEEIDRILTTLPFAPMHGTTEELAGIDPSILYSGPTFYESLGVDSTILIHRPLVRTPYSGVAHRGANSAGFDDLEDLSKRLPRLVRETASPRFIHVYWDALDSAAHRYGPFSPEHFEEAKRLSDAMMSGLPRGALLLVTADHGQIRIDPSKIVYLNQWPEVAEEFAVSRNGRPILPWGTPRDVFLRVREPDRARALLQDRLQDKAVVLRSEELYPLFGEGRVAHPSRFGNLILLCRENHAVWFEHKPGKRFGLTGVHCGLTPTEMRIPFAACAL